MIVKDKLYAVILSTLILGSFGLAVIDPDMRPMFLEMTKVSVVAYGGAKVQKTIDQQKKKD